MYERWLIRENEHQIKSVRAFLTCNEVGEKFRREINDNEQNVDMVDVYLHLSECEVLE